MSGKPQNGKSVKFCGKSKQGGGLKMFTGANDMLVMDFGGSGKQIEE